MTKPDLTYSCADGMWTRFFPWTPAGDDAYNVMAKADAQGVVAFASGQVASVLRQLRAAGLTVHKAKPSPPLSAAELDALFAELDA